MAYSYLIKDSPIDACNQLPLVPTRTLHDLRRSATYPPPISNTWYHLCNSEELPKGKVIEVRALNRVFALWRTDDGFPVAQGAFCIHLGANLAINGKVVDDCLECPFHRWTFDKEGAVKSIPYLTGTQHCLPTKKLKTYPCRDWCGLICVYFHADDQPPDFPLPDFIERSLEEEQWGKHLQWNIGFKTLSPIDWVDQAGDHAHFATLHGDFVIPWTRLMLPEWFFKIFPLGICHTVTTYKGDDESWKELVGERVFSTLGPLTPEDQSGGQYAVGKHYLFFEDVAGLTWNRKPLTFTLSKTMITFPGPAIMVFHIPFSIGAFKAFVTTTPVEGGSIMRVRTFVDFRVRYNPFKRLIAWFLSGISASQLIADIDILVNKIRLERPLLQPFDGPYNRVKNWLKQFYSDGSEAANSTLAKYKNDW